MSRCYCGSDERCDVCRPGREAIVNRVLADAANRLAEQHVALAKHHATASGFVSMSSIRVSQDDLDILQGQLYATCSDASLDRWRRLRAELEWLRREHDKAGK